MLKTFTYTLLKNVPSYEANLHNGFMDTFSIAGAKFRYRLNPDIKDNDWGSDSACVVEKLCDTGWQINVYSLYSNKYTDSILADINGDGYSDLIGCYQLFTLVHFFNQETKCFDTAVVSLGRSWRLLDKKRKILCDNVDYRGEEISITLYTFHGLEPVPAFYLQFTYSDSSYGYNDTDEDIRLWTIKLYRTEAMKFTDEGGIITPKGDKWLIASTKEKHNIDYYYNFDYIKYWRDRYKKLLGIKNKFNAEEKDKNRRGSSFGQKNFVYS